MAAYASGRSGLALRVQPGDRGGSDDFNQTVDALLAGKRVILDLLGGEAIYAGGAAVLGDLTGGGKNYPAVTLIVADDSGNPWPFQTISPTAIEFDVTGTAAGAARLYAVPVMLSGVSPAAADGRWQQVRFVADDVANTAPEHALLLGSGTISGSAFAAYTPAATAPATSVIAPKAHATSHKHGGSDEIATATAAANAIPKADGSGKLDGWVTDASTSAKGKVQLATDGGTAAGTAVQANDARLSNARTPTAHASLHAAAGSDPLTGYALLAAANNLSARNAFVNGLLAVVRDAKFGPPASGTYVAGDWWMDRAGALWYYTGSAWEQVTAGAAGTWTAGGAADITTAANWNGGALLNGYRVVDSGTGLAWTYDTTLARWKGAVQSITLAGANALAATSSPYLASMSDNFDWYLEEFTCAYAAAAGTWDASNKWGVTLRKVGSWGASGLADWSLEGEITAAGTSGLRLAPAAGSGGILDTSSKEVVLIRYTKTGSPGNLTTYGPNALVRPLRK